MIEGKITPIVREARPNSLLAAGFGENLSALMAAMTRAFLSGLTGAESLITRDTVEMDTLA